MITRISKRSFLEDFSEQDQAMVLLKKKDDAWSVPDIVVIDGGKGQLTAALKGMAKAIFFPSNMAAINGDGDEYTFEKNV
mmetsp:Transcript_2123/g.5010  ORF Transcript_2123/g.5010 Transcript_2123/m.5010 type:complete len:80 (+) Transcript_2123:992-1231(+)